MWIQSDIGRVVLAAGLLLLLSGYGGYSQNYYQITEAELTELETTLTRQADTIESLQTQLTRQSETLDRLSGTIDEQQSLLSAQWTTIDELRESFSEYEREASRATIRAGGIGFAVGGLTVVSLFVILR